MPAQAPDTAPSRLRWRNSLYPSQKQHRGELSSSVRIQQGPRTWCRGSGRLRVHPAGATVPVPQPFFFSHGTWHSLPGSHPNSEASEPRGWALQKRNRQPRSLAEQPACSQKNRGKPPGGSLPACPRSELAAGSAPGCSPSLGCFARIQIINSPRGFLGVVKAQKGR